MSAGDEGNSTAAGSADVMLPKSVDAAAVAVASVRSFPAAASAARASSP